MPTSWRRIAVTEDPELKEALDRVAPLFPDAGAARIVRDLALRGAESLLNDREREDEAIEALVALSTRRWDVIDWDVLERVEELAWGE